MVRYLEERGRNNVHGHQAHPRMRVLQLPFSQHEHPLRRELDRNSLSEASYILSFPVLASTTGVLCTGVNLQLYILKNSNGFFCIIYWRWFIRPTLPTLLQLVST
ncbi:uncharacterized protein LOC119984450 isoform X3 [Tripterygium wilfordii]|uniref:uncharacterized protein LOC119984450 isoform X3 n=1 Tax=Tripterygium wilfordii TaxID=458696 RepID=UPI0018F857EF|nr:uncharacterized protein LOC119984450 isoform X3 [Tripterygium wilfordii]